MNQKDQKIIRELAKKYMEIACSEQQQKMNARFQASNDLKIVRPPVLIDEIPWYQINVNGELDCFCEEPKAKAVELHLRKKLFYARYFKTDRLMDPVWKVHMSASATGSWPGRQEQILRTDDINNIVSHSFEDVLEDESVLEQMEIPTFRLNPEADAENMDYYTELFGDSMPVKLVGRGYIYFAPWDEISFLRGVEPLMFDLYDRPEYTHKIMERFIARQKAEMDFWETHGHIDPTGSNLHCTPAAISGLAEDGWKASWFRAMAQCFSSVSPAMHDEFEIQYIKPLAERCAYTYYGCCEPLDNKIEVIRQIKNLRKIGVSPWANIESSAEQIGGDYVYARKPNPANVAIHTDPDVIRRETEETVKACIRYGCPSEFVLKDISTVSHRLENLTVWAETVSDVLDRYYGE